MTIVSDDNEKSMKLAHAISVSKLVCVSIYNNNIGDSCAVALASAVREHKHLLSFYLYGTSMTNQGLQEICDAVLANPNIIYFGCDLDSVKISKKMLRRRSCIELLIKQCNAMGGLNCFGTYELSNFYNNMHAMVYVSKREGEYNKNLLLDFTDFQKNVISVLCKRYSSVVLALLNTVLQQDLVKPILSMWAQLPYTIKSEVSNIPELPKVLMQDDWLQSITR